MVVISFIGFLFKRRMTLHEIIDETGDIKHPDELILKIFKWMFWYILISVMYYSFQQPIAANTIGFDGSWPLDLFWFCIDKTCDLARTALQYRMSIKWQ